MRRIFSLFVMILSLTGCMQNSLAPQSLNSMEKLKDIHYRVDRRKHELVMQEVYEVKDKDGKIRRKTRVERVPIFDKEGKKSLTLKRKKIHEISVEGKRVKISVENIPLHEFVTLVFGSVLKLNYTLDKSVQTDKDLITLHMQRAQKSQEFYEVVKKILSLHGVLIKHKNNTLFLYKSSRGAKLSFQNIYIGYGRELPRDLEEDREVLLFVPYYYIKKQELISIAQKVGISSTEVKFYNTIKGMQTLLGKAYNVRKVLKLIRLLDKPFLKDKSAYLVNLDNIEVEKFVQRMKEIFNVNNIRVSDTPSSGGIVMLPIRELNMLYVITPKKAWLDMLLYWKSKLDIPSKTSQEPRLYIYAVKNRKADELATAIKEVIGLSLSSDTKSPKKPKNSPLSKIAQAPYTPTVSADKDTNILMLKLTPKHYRMLLPFIKRLDRLPLQTLVNVTVAEVTMTDTFSLGFEHAIRKNSAGLIKSILNITGGGSGLGIVFEGNYIDVIINAYAEKKLLNIISRPRVLILNNNTGSINVGSQVPVVTSEVSASDLPSDGSKPTINRNIVYRNTGINLGLTPTINSNGVLTMNISINLSEAQLNNTSGIDSPLIINRSLNTVAVINSGDTILIGGLISQNISKSKGGVPLLKDLPILGDAFSSQSKKIKKTELIMLIRPTIIRNRGQMRRETYRFKKLLNTLEAVSL